MRCDRVEALLSEYIDGALSARETLDVDMHLAGCNGCTRALNEMRRTVALLADAPAFEVSGEFSANLMARIASLEPEPARRTWASNFAEMFRPRVRPLWATAAAACALAVLVVIQRSPENAGPAAPSASRSAARFIQTARTQSIALTASDPFGDTAAANVAASLSSTGQPVQPESGGETIY